MRVLVLAALGVALFIGLLAATSTAQAAAERTEISGFCFGVSTDNDGGIILQCGATATVVQNKNTWTLVADVTHDFTLTRAVHLRSLGSTCGAPGLTPTLDWNIVTRPNGTARIVCQGEFP